MNEIELSLIRTRLFFIREKYMLLYRNKNDNYILKEEFIMLNIIIAGALVYGVLIGVDKMLNYGKENNLYVEGYLQK